MYRLNHTVVGKYQPNDIETLWLDVSDTSNLILKAYVDSKWLPLRGYTLEELQLIAISSILVKCSDGSITIDNSINGVFDLSVKSIIDTLANVKPVTNINYNADTTWSGVLTYNSEMGSYTFGDDTKTNLLDFVIDNSVLSPKSTIICDNVVNEGIYRFSLSNEFRYGLLVAYKINSLILTTTYTDVIEGNSIITLTVTSSGATWQKTDYTYLQDVLTDDTLIRTRENNTILLGVNTSKIIEKCTDLEIIDSTWTHDANNYIESTTRRVSVINNGTEDICFYIKDSDFNIGTLIEVFSILSGSSNRNVIAHICDDSGTTKCTLELRVSTSKLVRTAVFLKIKQYSWYADNLAESVTLYNGTTLLGTANFDATGLASLKVNVITGATLNGETVSSSDGILNLNVESTTTSNSVYNEEGPTNAGNHYLTAKESVYFRGGYEGSTPYEYTVPADDLITTYGSSFVFILKIYSISKFNISLYNGATHKVLSYLYLYLGGTWKSVDTISLLANSIYSLVYVKNSTDTNVKIYLFTESTNV